MRNPRRTITTVLLVAMAAWWIGANAYAQPAAPVVARADCDTITVMVGEEIPAPRIPTLYVVTVAVADGERTWELGAGDVLEVDRSWPGSAWAVWLWGELHASGPEDDSCVWDYDIVVDTDQPVDVTIPQIIFDEKSQPDAVKKPEPPTVPAGIRWF